MYEDYLANGLVYKEDYPSVNLFPSANKVLKQKKNQKKRKNYSKVKMKYASNTLLQNRSNIKDLQKQLKSLSTTSDNVSKNSSSILKGMENILGLTLIVSVALLSLKKYVDTKESVYSPEYAPDKEEHGDYGGRYKETDTTSKIKNKIIDEAQRQGVDSAWALSIAEQESHFNPKAKSSKGAIGIFQLMPKTAKWLGVKDPWNVDQNIQGGIKYLKWLDKYYKGDKWKATAAYNRGQGNIDKDLAKGLDADTYTNRTKVNGQSIGYAKSVFNKYDKYKGDVAELKKQAQKEAISKSKGTKNAGEKRKIYSGDKYHKDIVKIGGYSLYNPTLHDGGRRYIELSDRAESYLRDVGGSGIVTTGAEGKHSESGPITHKLGNKLDIQPLKGSSSKNIDYAKTAIPFIRNKNTAYINFESFTLADMKQIVSYIYSNAPELKSRCESSVKLEYMARKTKDEKTIYGYGKFLTSINTGNSRHLDIGILPNAYSKNQAKQEQKIAEKSANTIKAQKNNTILKTKDKKVKAKTKNTKKSNSTQKPIIVVQPKKQQKVSNNSMGSPSFKKKVQNDKDARKRATKY